MKLFLFLLACSSALCSCSFTHNTHAASNLKRMELPRYQYIYDYYSRVKQVQMLNHKREIKEGNTFCYVLTGDESMNDEKDFKRIKLMNKSAKTLYGDIIAEVDEYEMNPVDPSDTMNIVNVKKIRVPAGESLTLILPLRRPYRLNYGFSSDEEKNQRHDFIPATSRTRFIVRESRIKGSFVRTNQ